jgi:hypothetical protein
VVREEAIQEAGNHGDYPATVSDRSETQAWVKTMDDLLAKNVRYFDGDPMGHSDLHRERVSMEGRGFGLSYESPFMQQTTYQSSSPCILQEERESAHEMSQSRSLLRTLLKRGKEGARRRGKYVPQSIPKHWGGG